MSDDQRKPFAVAGERVVTEEGEYICRVKNDLYHGDTSRPDDFEDWQYPKPAGGDPYGKGFRGRPAENGGDQVCIEGDWRP